MNRLRCCINRPAKLPSDLVDVFPTVLWIRISFSADLDPALLISVWIRIQVAKPMRTRINGSGSFSDLKAIKSWILHLKNILKVGNRPRNIPTKVQSIFERQDTGFICKFWSASLLLDPDPDPHSLYGSDSGSRTAKQMLIRIHNTVFTIGVYLCKELNRGTSLIWRFFPSASSHSYFPHPLEHSIISGSEDGQHPGDRRGGQGAHQRHLHPQEPRRERGDDPLRKAALRRHQPLLFIGRSWRHCSVRRPGSGSYSIKPGSGFNNCF